MDSSQEKQTGSKGYEKCQKTASATIAAMTVVAAAITGLTQSPALASPTEASTQEKSEDTPRKEDGVAPEEDGFSSRPQATTMMAEGDCGSGCNLCTNSSQCANDSDCIWDDMNGDGSNECFSPADYGRTTLTGPTSYPAAIGCKDDVGQLVCSACDTKEACTEGGCTWFSMTLPDGTGYEGCIIPPHT